MSDGQWHHVVGVYDRVNLYLYLDGMLKASSEAPGKMKTDDEPVYIGENPGSPKRFWKGFIDEVAIFDHALSQDEITQLYRTGTTSFTSDPTLLMLNDAVGKAEAIIKEEKPEEAIAFLEKKIDEFEQWRKKDPNSISVHHKVLFSDLYFLLGKAKEGTGAPKGEVADIYKCVIRSGTPSALSYRSALLWLSENENAGQYQDIINSLIQNNSNYLGMVAERAETMLKQQKPKEALKLLEDNLTVYAHWRKEHPYDDVVAKDQLPGLYFQMAQAKEALGSSNEDIADSYRKTFSPSRLSYLPEWIVALKWLLANEPIGDYVEIVKSFMPHGNIKELDRDVFITVYKYSASKRNWVVFERFLDALLSVIKDKSTWVRFIESCLGEEVNQWAQAYSEYHDSNRKLNFNWDWITEKYMADENFKKAVQRCQDIIESYDLGQNKAAFEWRLCESLFSAGEYSEAASGLENFIANYKASRGDLVKEAILMKGRTYVKLGELDKAIEIFLNLMMEYPETRNVPEVNFFVGYCYMLQNKFEAAIEVFNSLVKDYPDSPYTNKARMCITRIKSMTGR